MPNSIYALISNAQMQDWNISPCLWGCVAEPSSRNLPSLLIFTSTLYPLGLNSGCILVTWPLHFLSYSESLILFTCSGCALGFIALVFSLICRNLNPWCKKEVEGSCNPAFSSLLFHWDHHDGADRKAEQLREGGKISLSYGDSGQTPGRLSALLTTSGSFFFC